MIGTAMGNTVMGDQVVVVVRFQANNQRRAVFRTCYRRHFHQMLQPNIERETHARCPFEFGQNR